MPKDIEESSNLKQESQKDYQMLQSFERESLVDEWNAWCDNLRQTQENLRIRLEELMKNFQALVDKDNENIQKRLVSAIIFKFEETLTRRIFGDKNAKGRITRNKTFSELYSLYLLGDNPTLNTVWEQDVKPYFTSVESVIDYTVPDIKEFGFCNRYQTRNPDNLEVTQADILKYVHLLFENRRDEEEISLYQRDVNEMMIILVKLNGKLL